MFDTKTLLPARLWLRLADFAHPADVLSASDLSADDRRRILACWASDAHVPESRPALRWLPGTPGPVPLRSVLAALTAIDRQTETDAVMAGLAAGRGGARIPRPRLLPSSTVTQ